MRRNEQDTKLRPWKFFDSTRNESSLQQKLAQKKTTRVYTRTSFSLNFVLCCTFFVAHSAEARRGEWRARGWKHEKAERVGKNMRNSRHTLRPNDEKFTLSHVTIYSLCGLAMLVGAGCRTLIPPCVCWLLWWWERMGGVAAAAHGNSAVVVFFFVLQILFFWWFNLGEQQQHSLLWLRY